jgi:glycosyltransferase involved in cell wall biosynthesis
MTPKVSVVIPLFNKSSYIARAINSVFSQTIQDFEIIVVDDYSSDEGPAIVQSYHDPRISFIAQEHRGVSYTRNHGVDLAKSDFIAFLDADDEWMPNHLEILLRLKGKFPDAGIYTAAYQTFTKSGRLEYPRYWAIPKSPFEGLLPNYFESAALGVEPVAVSVAGIFKELFFESGGFPIDESKGEDLDLWAKIALKYPIAFSSEIGAIIHEEATNRACDSHQSMEEPLFVKNAKNALADGMVPERMVPYYKEYIARLEIITAESNILAGNYPLARKVLARTETRYLWLQKLKWSIVIRIPKTIFESIIQVKKFISNGLKLLKG